MFEENPASKSINRGGRSPQQTQGTVRQHHAFAPGAPVNDQRSSHRGSHRGNAAGKRNRRIEPLDQIELRLGVRMMLVDGKIRMGMGDPASCENVRMNEQRNRGEVKHIHRQEQSASRFRQPFQIHTAYKYRNSAPKLQKPPPEQQRDRFSPAGVPAGVHRSRIFLTFVPI